MPDNFISNLPRLLSGSEQAILNSWVEEQFSAGTLRLDLIQKSELKKESEIFLELFNEAIQKKITDDINDNVWNKAKEFLSDLSSSRAIKGFTPSEVATFVFSLKQSLIKNLKEVYAAGDIDGLLNDIWFTNSLLDNLGLFTTEVYIKNKEELITRQQFEMIELSTPVVQLWNGILALPLIGTLDSARTQVVMENLLTKIVETSSFVAIIDITGVPTVDTLVAQHLLKTVAAARLMGADCIISGIRPQIAQTIVHLGVNLEEVITKATMADAFKLALKQLGESVGNYSK